MKIRTDFVTNSSSSSFITVYKHDTIDMDVIKEEFGNRGVKWLQQSTLSGKEMFEHIDDYYYCNEEETKELIEENFTDFDIEGKYIYADRISYTNDGDSSDPVLAIIDDPDFTKLFTEVFRWGEE